MSVHEISEQKPDAMHLEVRPVSVRQQRRMLAGDLDNIVLKALRKEPSRRYASAEQLSEDIRRHLEGLPVTATPDSLSYRARKFVQRHRVGVAASALIAIAIAAGVYATVRQARIAEANRRRAEARFNDVRKLANSLIFEVHDSIAALPGAGKARQIILQRALEYLDGLSKEAGNEPDLLRELATAYQRIGSLQGNPMASNLGDIKDAAVNMQKAVAQRESLARMNPGNRKDQVELAAVYLEVSEFQGGVAGNPGAAFEYCKKAQAILDREMQNDPANFRIVAQSVRAYSTLGFLQIGNGVQGTVGTVKGGVAASEEALRLDLRALQLSPTNINVLGQEVMLNILLGDGRLKLGDTPQALAHFHRGLDIANTLGAKSNNIPIMANTYVIMSRIADTLMIEGKIAEAITWYRKTQEGAMHLSSLDPGNETVQRLAITSAGLLGHGLIEGNKIDEGLKFERLALTKAEAQPSQTPLVHTFQAIATGWIGEGAERKGRLVEALTDYKKSQEIYRALRDAGTNDLRMQVFYSASTDRVASTLVKLGRAEDAKKEDDNARAVLEPLLEANPENTEVMYALAETYTGEGNVSAQLARKATSQSQRAGQWSTSIDWYEKSLNVWSRVTNPAWQSTSLQEVTVPSEVSRRLNASRAQQLAARQESPVLLPE